MLASLIAALFAAVCYGVASVMQAVATRAASTRQHGASQAGVDPALLKRLFRQWRFAASIALDLIGFAAQLIALRRLPVFAVQAIVAANLAVIALLATVVIGGTLSAREWAAVTGVIAGVGMLGAAAGPEGANHASTTFKVALIAATVAAGLAGLAAARARGSKRTLLLGTVAGFGYGLIGLAARVLSGFAPLSLLTDPAAYAVVGAGIVSFVFYTTALEGGSVTVATAAVVLAETLPPALIGIAFLGDTTRPGLAPVAVAGFFLAVISAVALARFGEPAGPAGPAAEPVLSWWPVDLRLYAVTSQTTGAPSWPAYHRIPSSPGPPPTGRRSGSRIGQRIPSTCSSPAASRPASARG